MPLSLLLPPLKAKESKGGNHNKRIKEKRGRCCPRCGCVRSWARSGSAECTHGEICWRKRRKGTGETIANSRQGKGTKRRTEGNGSLSGARGRNGSYHSTVRQREGERGQERRVACARCTKVHLNTTQKSSLCRFIDSGHAKMGERTACVRARRERSVN